eukprot:2251261-Pleurochrysis_carterae.AAC.1
MTSRENGDASVHSATRRSLRSFCDFHTPAQELGTNPSCAQCAATASRLRLSPAAPLGPRRAAHAVRSRNRDLGCISIAPA